MSDYPDPDEEYELMYGDELDLLRETELEENVTSLQGKQVRRSLDFSSPAVRRTFNTELADVQKKRKTELNDTIGDFESTEYTEASSTSCAYGTDGAKKRTVDELFGDIDDINFDEYELSSSKRHKSEPVDPDPDLTLIKRILEGRKLRAELTNSLVGIHKDYTSSSNSDRSNLSTNIPRWPFIKLVREDGERIYVRFHSEEYMDKELDDVANAGEGLKTLLGTTYKDTWKMAKKILETKLENENIKKVQDADTKLSDELQMLEDNVGEADTRLWVERYKPKCYVELLSDEATNRTILHWLKLWDKVVFNKEVKIKAPQTENAFNKKSGKFEFGGKWKNRSQNTLNTDLDEHGRPFHKMALLCGPPGCGKTTLAHLIARQAGYRPVEVNASDDRSVEAFKTALENATHMKSVIDREKRPNCLILDEIDGAPLPAIEFLVKFCSGAPLGRARKGQKAKPHVLRRPILCICNDPYAPALRPLRAAAFVVHFPPTQSQRLTQRLSEIASLQNLSVDISALAALSDKTANDIRACLGVLYFFKAKGKQVRLADVLRINVGQKDMSKGMYPTLCEIFRIELPTHRRAGVGRDADVATDNEPPTVEQAKLKRFNKILSTVSSAGDFDRLSQGVFENYLQMRMKDSSLDTVCSALDWFRHQDCINSKMLATQNYVLMPYLPIAFVTWHFLFASIARQKVNFPKQGLEIYQKQTMMSGTLVALQRGLSAKLRPYCSRQALVLDIMPTLPHIITPQLKSANIQLYTEKERAELHNVVSTMADFNINYVQERTQEGSYNFNLEPDVQKIGFFESKLSRTLAYAMKQVISREVEVEKMSRAELKSTDHPNTSSKSVPLAPRAPLADPVKAVAEDNPTLPNHLQRLQPKKIETNGPTLQKDFFGRVVSVNPAPVAVKKDGSRDLIAESQVFYHYQEGFNNAVRRQVRMQDLL